MAAPSHLDGHIDHLQHLRDAFRQIRDEAETAASRDDLVELYRRAEYLVSLTHSQSLEERFGDEAAEMRAAAIEEFTRAARAVNARAEEIGTPDNFDESWSEP